MSLDKRGQLDAVIVLALLFNLPFQLISSWLTVPIGRPPNLKKEAT